MNCLLPMRAEFLYGSSHYFSAHIIKEFLPILDGSVLKYHLDHLFYDEPEIIKVIKWVKTEKGHEAYIPYKCEEWTSMEEGNKFLYTYDPRKLVDLPIDVEITTTLAKSRDVILPLSSEVKITGELDDILMFKLSL